jgi:hypothetical protein
VSDIFASTTPFADTTPKGLQGTGVTEGAPRNSVPERAPRNGVPEEAPRNGVPGEAPRNGVSERAPRSDMPEGAPRNGVPERAPTNGMPNSDHLHLLLLWSISRLGLCPSNTLSTFPSSLLETAAFSLRRTDDPILLDGEH